jgi:protein TonB
MKKRKIKPPAHGHGPGGERARISQGKYDANLRKRGIFHFQLGLILALLLVYFGLELSFRVYAQENKEVVALQEATWVIEADMPPVVPEAPLKKIELPITSKNFIPVPDALPVDPAPDVIPLPDESENTGLVPGNIAFVKENEPVEIPFTVIEEAPVYPGCETVEAASRLSCFQEMMKKHIRDNFRYPQFEKDLEIEGKVYVTFKILEDGSISNIKLKGPSPGLEREAERIILKLPRMTPGKQRGKPVRVPYSIPIFFQLQ